MMEYLPKNALEEATKQRHPEPTEEDREKANAERIRTALNGEVTPGDRIALLAERWPLQVFVSTAMKRKSDAATRVLVGGAVEETNPIYRGILGQFPSLCRTKGKPNICTIRATDAFQERGNEEFNHRTLVVTQEMDQSGGKTERAERCLNVAQQIADEVRPTEEAIYIMVPEKGSFLWRNALETALWGRQTSLTLCTRRNHGPREGTGKKQPRHAEVIVSGKSYAEVTKELRQNASAGSNGVEIW